MAFQPSSIGAVNDPLAGYFPAGTPGFSQGFPNYPGLGGQTSAADRALGLSPDMNFPPIPGFPTAQPFPGDQSFPGGATLPVAQGFPGTPTFPGGAANPQAGMFPGTPGYPGGSSFPSAAPFGTQGFGGPQGAQQAADVAVRMACACGIDGCDCDDAVGEINNNAALVSHLQQNFQAQQLGQLVGLLVALMQNKGMLQQKGNSKKKMDQVSAASSAADDDGHGHGGGGGGGGGGSVDSSKFGGPVAGATNVNGVQVVTRMGKQIGAKIANQFDAMVAAAKQDGVTLSITSGFRSRAEQEKLYAAYQAGTGNLAAKPGTSNHESGEAIDFGGGQAAYDWLAKNASKFGMYGKIAGEPWHYSLSGH